MNCFAQWLRLGLVAAYRLERYKLTLYGREYAMPRIRGESLVAWRARMAARLRSYAPYYGSDLAQRTDGFAWLPSGPRPWLWEPSSSK